MLANMNHAAETNPATPSGPRGNELDVSGAYKARGRPNVARFHPNQLASDRDTILDRSRSSPVGCLLHATRHDGAVPGPACRGEASRGGAGPAFRCVDGTRINNYARSNTNEAVDVWIEASAEILRAVVYRDVIKNRIVHQMIHRAGKNVW